jgi:cytochrome P450
VNAEVDQLSGDPDRLPGIDDVDRLPFTRMVLSESMRLYPPAWIQGREALEDTVVGGHPVKRGQTVFVSQWLTHHDPRWWKNPEVFDPDRFSSETPAQIPVRTLDQTPRPRWAYFPFGGGMRSCIGEAFAWTEAILVLAVLTWRWTFEPAPGAPPIELEPGITLRPAGSVPLVVRRR